MATFRPKPGSIEKLKRELAAVTEKKARRLSMALSSWGDEAVAAVWDEIRKVGAVDQGQLMGATTRSEPVRKGTKLGIRIFNPLEYASVVEFGRRGKRGAPPPLLPLIGWAKRKGIISVLPTNPSMASLRKELAASAAIARRAGKGGGSKGPKKPLDPIVRELLIVRLIARKIFERGIVGRHPFTIAFTRKKRTINRDVARLVELAS